MRSGSAGGHGAPRTVVVKVGGSLVSDKRTDHDIDEAAVRDYAELVADLVRSHPGRVVFVAGAVPSATPRYAVRNTTDDWPCCP